MNIKPLYKKLHEARNILDENLIKENISKNSVSGLSSN